MSVSNPIRVLLTVPHLSTKSSPSREMMALARYLPKDEFKLTICSLRPRGFEEMRPVLQSLNVDCFVAQFRPRGGMFYMKDFTSSLWDQRRIDKYGPYDIQHSLDFVSMPFEAVECKIRSRKYIFNQGILGEDLKQFLLRVKGALASGVIAVSDSVLNLLVDCGIPKKKIRKIRLGIDIEDADLQLRANGVPHNLVLAVGNIIRYKRHEDGIRAFAVLSKKHPDLRMAIAGRISDKDYYQELLDLSAQLGVNHKIQFLGLRADVIDLMKEAAILIHCAEPEAFGWVILEAMAVGLPVVAAAAGGPGEIIEHNRTGLLAPVSSIEDFAEGIDRLLVDDQFSQRLISNAREMLEQQYSAREMVRKTAEFYRDIISCASPSLS